MSLFRLNSGFRLPENKRGCQFPEITSENAISSCVMRQNTPRYLQYFGSLEQGVSIRPRHSKSQENPGITKPRNTATKHRNETPKHQKNETAKHRNNETAKHRNNETAKHRKYRNETPKHRNETWKIPKHLNETSKHHFFKFFFSFHHETPKQAPLN